MLNEDFSFFNTSRDEIIKNHINEFVVIKDKKVVGYFPDEHSALVSMKGNPLGSFLVQRCVSEKDGIIEYYTGRVVFA